MKILIQIIFVLIELSSFSQDFNHFDYNKRLDWAPFENEKVTVDFLKNNFPDSVIDEYFKEFIIKHPELFHFFDIDSDQVDELIYNGWNGGEGEMVTIYKQSGNRFIENQNFLGRIVEIKITPSRFPQMIVYDYSCCAGIVDHLQTFDFNDSTGQFEIVKAIVKIVNTEIPKEWIEPKRFEILNSPYYLRYSPEIVSGISDIDYEFKPLIGQNIAALYKKGDQGTVYSETKDSTGRIWWFVVMDSKPDDENMLFYEGNNEFDNYQPIGWMSSKFLKELE